jgi:aryl-alcohol dehydrogenase-like predicted oxidoreductase
MAEFAETRPVETLQPAYHLFRREIEEDVLPYTNEHDVGVLVYGPLAHGMLTGTFQEPMSFPPGDWRADAPFFRDEDFRRNLAAVGELEALAAELGCNVSQLAIAWTLANPAVDVSIVGSRSPRHIGEAADAAAIQLGEDDLGRIDRIMASTVPIAGPSPEMAID